MVYELHYWVFPLILSEIKATTDTLSEAIDIAYDLVLKDGLEKERLEIKKV